MGTPPAMTHAKPHLAQGAARERDGQTAWRLWAPEAELAVLVTRSEGQEAETAMQPEGNGYFVHRQGAAPEGLRYAYRLNDGPEYPDPASRWQPEGVHHPSAVFYPEDFAWSDDGWRGVPRDDLVIYELHVGAFTPEGTFDAVVPRLAQLAELGVTAVELMPVAQFPGDRNWGYDGVHPFAAQNTYGGPRALQRLVDAAHRAGLAVLLDVVYNHFGPEGNYLACFGPYFTDRYRTPWGKAVNFDGPDCDAVRRFVADNACYWVRDFHIDGLRLDAVHAIYDLGARHILAELQAAVQEEAARRGRTVHVIAETNQNDVRLIDPPDRGGFGLDGLWSDDFHHAVHALLTGERAGYYQDFGRPEHLVKAFERVFVYDGCHSPYRRRRHGNPVADRDRSQFVVCIQNHDQVGNRALGDRFEGLLAPEARRLACGLLMLSPCVPLLFMGEEYGETNPFPFFCSFGDPELMDAVRRGRREEFAALAFRWGAELPDPLAAETFASARLGWNWSDDRRQAGLRRLYGDLLSARRRWPGLRDRRQTSARLVCPPQAADEAAAPPILLVERGGADGVIACANLHGERQAIPRSELGGRTIAVLSTESPQYGGRREAGEPGDSLGPLEMLIFAGSPQPP